MFCLNEQTMFSIIIGVFLMAVIKCVFFKFVKTKMMCYRDVPHAKLHMRFGKCPKRFAYKKISRHVESVLIHAKNNGCKTMTIYSHLVRRGNEKRMMRFLNQEGMNMVSLIYKPTPLGHKIVTQIDSVLTRFEFSKIKNQSGFLVIRLNE